MTTIQDLIELQPEKEFFIGIDSDGCVFDSMELKHKECFCPAFINHFNLQSVSRYAREAWEFVNLYSVDRGGNRFLTALKSLDLLRERVQVKKRGIKIIELPVLKAWTEKEINLSNPKLKAEIDKTDDPELMLVYQWSLDVNEAVAKISRGILPFPYFSESLDKMTEAADIVVVSQTPSEALLREWAELKIDKKARFIAGQETGSKSECISLAAGKKYHKDKILMIGDALGDLKAANAINALFYPIIPEKEDDSWDRFLNEAAGKFLNMNFRGAYQEALLSEFEKYLPKKAPWIV